MNLKRVDVFKYIFLLGLALLPLFYWPNAAVPFEVPKVHLVNRWIEVLIIVGILTNLKKPSKEKLDYLLVLLVACFFIATIISSYFGANFEKSIFGNYYRRDGLITLSHLIGLFLAVLVFIKKDWNKDIAVSISLGAFLLSLWTIFDSFKLYILKIASTPNWDGAVGVSFGNPNFLAGYLVVTLPFTYYLSTSTKTKVFIYLAPSIQLLALLLTKAEVGILVLLVFFALLVFLKKPKFRKIYLLLILASLVIGTFAMVAKIKGQRTDQLFAAEGRERILRKASLAFEKRPILGWGWANFDHAFDSVT